MIRRRLTRIRKEAETITVGLSTLTLNRLPFGKRPRIQRVRLVTCKLPWGESGFSEWTERLRELEGMKEWQLGTFGLPAGPKD